MNAAAPAAASISVIVATYNRVRYIGECLDSLLAQTVPALEILVVDDGSDDGTAQRVAAYGPRVRYVHQENAGKAQAVNRGLSLARGEWVWILDDDDVALPHANEHRLAALAAAPEAGFVYGPHHLGSDGPDHRVVRGRLVQPPPVEAAQFFLALMTSCFFHLGTALVKREDYLRLGGLDPALHRGQDYDFQIRLARVARPVFCAEPAFVFRQHAGVRGTKATRHAADNRGGVFMQYSQAVGLKLRTDVPLGEYLVPRLAGLADGALAPEARAQALLNRMAVMGNHGCVAELLQDVETLLQVRAAAGEPLRATDREGMARAMRAGWACDASLQEGPRFLAQAARLKRQPGGKAAVRALASGVLALARGYPDTLPRRWAKSQHAARLAWQALV